VQPVDFLPHWLAETLFWFYYNQTLIAGLAALSIGWLTVQEIRRQIRVSEGQFAEEQKRQLRVDRAYLSQSLSEITKYSIDCLQALTEQLYKFEEDTADLTQTGFSIPEFPHRAFASLRPVALNEDGDTFTVLATLISFAQIHRARLESISADMSSNSSKASIAQHKANLYSPICDTVELEAWAASLFQYARFRASSPMEFSDKNWAKSRLEMHHCYRTDELLEYIDRNWSAHELGDELEQYLEEKPEELPVAT